MADMDSPLFVTLSAGGIQPESLPDSSQDSVSLGDSETSAQLGASSASSLSVSTHDTSRARYHITDVGIFAESLEQAAAATVFPNRGRPRYKNIRVLLLRWEEDPMGVQYELNDLARLFENAYGFETETWLIPTLEPHFALMTKALATVQQFGKADDLLIVYYAGHGLMNDSRQAVWTCTSSLDYASLQWFAIQTLFEQAKADVLLLLDCCAAASGAPANGQATSVTETIAACGFETSAPQPGRFSFTDTLIKVLDDWSNQPNFTAAMLHCEILNRLRHEKPEKRGRLKRFEYRRSPIHIVNTRDYRARSIILSPRDTRIRATTPLAPETLAYDLSSLTKVLATGETVLPQVLITLALEEDQELDVEQCRRWLQEFPALAKYAKVQGVYKSNSTLLLLSIPVVVWDFIPGDPACNFIGYVHSENLIGTSFDLSVESRSRARSLISSISLRFQNLMGVPSKFIMTLVGLVCLISASSNVGVFTIIQLDISPRFAYLRHINYSFLLALLFTNRKWVISNVQDLRKLTSRYLRQVIRRLRHLFTKAGGRAAPQVVLANPNEGNQKSGKQHILEQAHILEDALRVFSHRNVIYSSLASEVLPQYDIEIGKLENRLEIGKFDSENEKKIIYDLDILKKQREFFSRLESMEKESQKVIDDIESQVTATRQELDEGGGANFQTMQSSRAAGLWWPPWWFQLIIVILLIFAGVLGQILGLVSLLLPEALPKLYAAFHKPVSHSFVNSFLEISVTLVFNVVLLVLLVLLGIKTIHWATEMVNIVVLNVNGTPTVTSSLSLGSKSNNTGSNPHANDLLFNVRSIFHLFRSLKFPYVLQHSKSLLRTVWSSGFRLSKILVFVLVGVVGVKSTAWIATIAVSFDSGGNGLAVTTMCRSLSSIAFAEALLESILLSLALVLFSTAFFAPDTIFLEPGTSLCMNGNDEKLPQVQTIISPNSVATDFTVYLAVIALITFFNFDLSETVGTVCAIG